MKIRLSDISKKLIWLLLLCFLITSSFSLLYVKYGSNVIKFFLIFVLFLSVLLFVIKNRMFIRFRLTPFHWYLAFFSAFCMLSALWALQPYKAFASGIGILRVSIVIILFFFLFQDEESVDALLKLIMYTGYSVGVVVILFYGWSGIINVLGDSRISSALSNSNDLGISVAYAMIINEYYIIYHKKKWQVFFLILAMIVLMATGSRTALLTALSGLCCIFILKYKRGRNIADSAIKGMLAVFLIILALFLLWRLPFFTSVKLRMMGLINGLLGNEAADSSTRIRMRMIEIGFSAFEKDPFLGVGMDNPRYLMKSILGPEMYLHNNYIEILAGGGFVGFAIYYGIYVSFIKGYKKYGILVPENAVCLSLLLATLVRDLGGVFYGSKQTYLILLICFFNLENCQKIRRTESKEEGLLQQ